MNKKEFPIRGHCFTDNEILLNYIKKTRARGYSENPIKKGIAWNQDMWWYVTKKSHNPEYTAEDLLKILNMNTEIVLKHWVDPTYDITSGSEVGVSLLTGLTTTGTGYCNIISGSSTNTAIVTHTSSIKYEKLINFRIKCRNLKKNLKMPLTQMSL